MPHKRREQDDQNQHTAVGGGRGKRSRWSRQHLYLVLDDWDKGFSVHKIDADSFVSCTGSDDDDYHGGVVARHLPEPPALRVESPDGRDEAHMMFSAMGTKIFVFMNRRCGLVYDADTAVLAVGAHAPAQMVCDFGGISVRVGDVVYLLTYRFLDDHGQHSFQAMSWAAAPTALDPADTAVHRRPTNGGGWSWDTLPPPPPTFTSRQVVVSHAVHPDGHTIFMTTANRDTPSAPLGTYSFNTMEATWRWHGECALPFLEQGHFDAELNAWVGLRKDGYICSCQAVSVDFVSTQPLRKHFAYIDPNIYLDCQTTKEKMFRKNSKAYIRASLTSMGSGRFCLVECVASKKRSPLFGDYDGCVLHMTIFGLKYNDKGELQITDQRSTRSFTVSRHISHFAPFAFWM